MHIAHHYKFLLVLGLAAGLIVSGCNRGKKVGANQPVADGNYRVTNADTTADAPTIASKANTLAMTNRLDDAIMLLNANIRRFKGKDKAIILDQRGTAFFMKDDYNHAIGDFLTANELDPSNPAYLINVSETYEEIGNNPNAVFFSKKILDLSNASDSDRIVANARIERCSLIRSH